MFSRLNFILVRVTAHLVRKSVVSAPIKAFVCYVTDLDGLLGCLWGREVLLVSA